MTLETVDLDARDEFEGFALYPWGSTEREPSFVVRNEVEAQLVAHLTPGGCEVRRVVVRMQSPGRDKLGGVLGAIASAQKALDEKQKELDDVAREAVVTEQKLDAANEANAQLAAELAEARACVLNVANVERERDAAHDACELANKAITLAKTELKLALTHLGGFGETAR